jgi:hypothetical protein
MLSRPLLFLSLATLAIVGVPTNGQEIVFTIEDQSDDAFLPVVDDLLLDTIEAESALIQFQPPRRGRPPAPTTSAPTTRRPQQGTSRGPTLVARVPSMFGDFFGGGNPISGPKGPAPPRGGAATRVVKISENYSPAPRNRVYATYHFFNDVFGGRIGDVNRYALGFESTYWDDMASVEVRFPFAHTLSSMQVDGPRIAKDTEFGNVTLMLKNVVRQEDDWLLSAGVGISFPTADDNRVVRPGDNRLILHIQNEAIHFLPFLGLIASPNDRMFVQTFVQLDIDANGNPARGDLMAMNLMPLGVVQDPTLMFLDFSLGYWLHDDPCSPFLTAAAPIIELHYTTTLNAADLLQRAGFLIGDLSRQFDILNLTLGTHFEFQDRWSLRPGFVIPLRDGDDRQFDFEFFLQANMDY